MITSGLKSLRKTRRHNLTSGSAYATMRDRGAKPFFERFPAGGFSSGGYLACIKDRRKTFAV
jgi:hypothetical protein